MVRKTIEDEGPGVSESEEWLSQLVDQQQLRQPTEASKVGPRFKAIYVGPDSRICGSQHRCVYDKDRDLYYCATCFTKLEKRLVSE